MADQIVREERARQGPKGKPVLFVLIGSMILLGAFLLMYVFWASKAPPESGRQDAARSSATNPTGTTATQGGNPSTQTLPANPAYPAPTDPTTGARR